VHWLTWTSGVIVEVFYAQRSAVNDEELSRHAVLEVREVADGDFACNEKGVVVVVVYSCSDSSDRNTDAGHKEANLTVYRRVEQQDSYQHQQSHVPQTHQCSRGRSILRYSIHL